VLLDRKEAEMMVRSGYLALSIALSIALLAAPGARAETPRTARIQAALEAWVAERALVEKNNRSCRLYQLRRSWSGDYGGAADVIEMMVGENQVL
jgi:hypothetical protein